MGFGIIQDIDEVTGKIGGFRALDGAISSPDVISLAGPLAQPGGDVIYAFIGEDRSIYAGTLKEIESELRDFLKRNSKRTAVALQVFELIGSDQDKKHARSAMRKVIFDAAGSSAASAFYEGSTLQSALWQRLLAMAPTPNSLRVSYR